ncbi:MAG: hypothetical protein ACW98Y_06720 [Candidatus Thorarchaeota archaeon]
MSEIESTDEIVPRILRRYSESPRGWRVMSTPVGDMLVVGKDSAFQLRIIPINPREYTGAGTELPESNDVIDSIRASPEFGSRNLTHTDIEALVESMSNPAQVQQQLHDILHRAPLLPTEIEKGEIDHLLTGPVLTRPDLSGLGPDILSLRNSLERSANRVFRKKYPMRAGMYF